MNLPGFTAEASLYKTNESYRTGKSFVQFDSAILPQACDPVCLSDCYDFDCIDLGISPGPRCTAIRNACIRNCCRRF
jgi:hypothetical protein